MPRACAAIWRLIAGFGVLNIYEVSQGNYCLPPAGVLHSQNKVIKFTAYGVAQGRGKGMEDEEEGVEWSKRMYGVRMSPAHPRYVGRGDDKCGG